MLLCSLVLSQLDYLSSVLTDLPKATLRPYNYIQRYATRLACNKTKWDSAQDCMKFLHWLSIEFRTRFKLLAIVFKTLQGNGPGYLQAKLNTKTHQRTTRRSTVHSYEKIKRSDDINTSEVPCFDLIQIIMWIYS